MSASLQALQRELRMGFVRRDDGHKVHIRLAKHLRDVRVSLNIREIGYGGLEARWVDFTHCRWRHASQLHFPKVVASHVESRSVADDSGSDVGREARFFHF